MEMTVRHLKQLQQHEQVQQPLGDATDADQHQQHHSRLLSRYQNGFSECAREVTRCLDAMVDMNSATKHRLVQHLTRCIHRITTDAAAAALPLSTEGTDVTTDNSQQSLLSPATDDNSSDMLTPTSSRDVKFFPAISSSAVRPPPPTSWASVAMPTTATFILSSGGAVPILSPVSLSPACSSSGSISSPASSSSSLPQSPQTPISPASFNGSVIPLYASLPVSHQHFLQAPTSTQRRIQLANDDYTSNALPLAVRRHVPRGLLIDQNNNNVTVTVSHVPSPDVSDNGVMVSPGVQESMWRPW